MSTLSTLDHPPDTSSLADPAISAMTPEQSTDQQVTLESAINPMFVRRLTSNLIQSCVLRAPIDPVPPRVLWEDAIPADIVDALGIPRGSCNAMSMADALLKMADLEERRRILCLMCSATGAGVI